MWLPRRDSKGVVVASPSYGLANRMRLVGSARIIADTLGKDLRILWGRAYNDMRDTRWHDLFEPSPDLVELEVDNPIDRLRLWFWRSPLSGNNRLHALGGLPWDRRAAHERLDFITHENTPHACVDRGHSKPCSVHAECSVVVDPSWKHMGLRGQFNYKLVGMSDEEYAQRMRAFYDSLRPVAAVATLAGALTRELPPRVQVENLRPDRVEGPANAARIAIGVHCRQTDNRNFFEGKIPNDTYHAHMDRALERFPNACFLVAADTRRTRDAARRRYGRRVLPHITESVGADPQWSERFSTVGQQAALADLIALSRTSLVIGTRFSSFSYVAAAWGGIPLVEAGYHFHTKPWA